MTTQEAIRARGGALIARERVLLAAYPAAMSYAGVGNYYGTYNAQRLFDMLQTGDLAIQPLKFEHTFYCKTCGNIASTRNCPHTPDHHLVLSGTRVREMLRAGTLPPPEFTRPEVAQILIEAMRAA